VVDAIGYESGSAVVCGDSGLGFDLRLSMRYVRMWPSPHWQRWRHDGTLTVAEVEFKPLEDLAIARGILINKLNDDAKQKEPKSPLSCLLHRTER
jgi:hypothetical protein